MDQNDMRRPLIGITAGHHSRVPGQYAVRWDYVRSVEMAGGIPIILAPSDAALDSGLDWLCGLVLSGGGDIDPEIYHEKPHTTTQRVSKERDEFELQLTRNALHRDIPVLGICRGIQVLNVALGGTLVQDIPGCTGSSVSHDDPNRPRHQMAHEVTIRTGTLLHRILKKDRVPVNSIHHQAVQDLGKGLTATAWSEDGIVEGTELPGAGFCVGVQWHPESFWDHGAIFSSLFEALVEAARTNRSAER